MICVRIRKIYQHIGLVSLSMNCPSLSFRGHARETKIFINSFFPFDSIYLRWKWKFVFLFLFALLKLLFLLLLLSTELMMIYICTIYNTDCVRLFDSHECEIVKNKEFFHLHSYYIFLFSSIFSSHRHRCPRHSVIPSVSQPGR